MKEILPGYFYVPIPEGAIETEITYSGDKLVFWDDCGFTEKQLPGSFTLLFTRDDATEEKWKEVVVFMNLRDGAYYKNYKRKDVYNLSTATESGASLLRSHNLPVEDNFVIVKREK